MKFWNYTIRELWDEVHGIFEITNFFLNGTSGNRTPGSRSYSDLVDTWANSVCIHQLVLKLCSKSTSSGSFQLMHSSSQDIQ